MPESFALTILRVERSDRTRIDVNEALLGKGVEFPSGTIVMEWYRGAYPESDRLEHPHQSIYGSREDLAQGTGGEVIVESIEDADGDVRGA